jgi:hypothetical protein
VCVGVSTDDRRQTKLIRHSEIRAAHNVRQSVARKKAVARHSGKGQ